MPADYKAVLTALGKTGDFKDGVLKVNIPRNDLHGHDREASGADAVRVRRMGGADQGRRDGRDDGRSRADRGRSQSGDVGAPQNGLDVTALHNHFFWEQPRIFYMHVHGMGSAADLATRVKPAIDLIDQAAKKAPELRPPRIRPAPPTLDGAALAKIIGTQGSRPAPSTRSPSAGLISTCASMARRSTRGWA